MQNGLKHENVYNVEHNLKAAGTLPAYDILVDVQYKGVKGVKLLLVYYFTPAFVISAISQKNIFLIKLELL